VRIRIFYRCRSVARTEFMRKYASSLKADWATLRQSVVAKAPPIT